jgi:hypothetical protein
MEEEKVILESQEVKPTKAKRTTKTEKIRTVDDISLSERASIDNLCDWAIGFVSEENGKSIRIEPLVKNYKRLTVAEIDAQVKINNVAFCGVDGFGSHAAFRINDPLVRESVFGEDINPVQLTEEAVANLLKSPTRGDFEDTLSLLVVTESEKRMIAIMCSDTPDANGKRQFPLINIDDAPSYMIAEIEKLSGIKIS